jgi:hypothetical protein
VNAKRCASSWHQYTRAMGGKDKVVYTSAYWRKRGSPTGAGKRSIIPSPLVTAEKLKTLQPADRKRWASNAIAAIQTAIEQAAKEDKEKRGKEKPAPAGEPTHRTIDSYMPTTTSSGNSQGEASGAAPMSARAMRAARRTEWSPSPGDGRGPYRSGSRASSRIWVDTPPTPRTPL